MKIAILIHDYTAMGGTERVTLQLCNKLAQTCSVSLISVQQTENTPAFSVSSEVQIAYLGVGETNMMRTLPQKIIALRRLLTELRPDVIISSDSQMALLSLPATIGLSCKNVIWEHFNASIETRFGSRWLARRMAARFADETVVLTEQDKKTWIDKYKCRTKLRVFPNPCALPLPSNNPYRHSRVVLAAGRYTEQKGFDYLVKAWQSLSSAQRSGWTLRIVGPNGSAKSDILDMARNDKSIIIDGPSNDMAECYMNSGIFVCSSRYEGFGLTIVEAMTHGVPVIVYDCPMGPAEIVGERFGIVLPLGRIDLLAKQLAQLIESSEERQYFSVQSYHRAASFTPEVTIELWNKMLNVITKQGQSWR